MTSRLGTGKSLTFFTVYEYVHIYPQAPQSLYSPPYLLSSLLSIFLAKLLCICVQCPACNVRIFHFGFRETLDSVWSMLLLTQPREDSTVKEAHASQPSPPSSPSVLRDLLLRHNAQIAPEAKMGKLC